MTDGQTDGQTTGKVIPMCPLPTEGDTKIMVTIGGTLNAPSEHLNTSTRIMTKRVIHKL